VTQQQQQANDNSASKEIIFQDVRLDWFDFYVPAVIRGNTEMKPRYSATLIFAPTHPFATDVANAIKHVAVAKWGADADRVLAALKADAALPLQDGAKKMRPEYEGMLFVAAHRAEKKGPPIIVDRQLKVLKALDRQDQPYRGCYVNGKVDIYAWKHPTAGNQINVGLNVIQFFRDGDAFTGGAPPTVDGLSVVSTKPQGSAGAGVPSSLAGLIG
jgi:hypothetical protein